VRELGSARVLELGFNKITILSLKMSKLTKQAFLCFGPVFKYWPVQPVFAGTAGISTGTKHRGQPYQIAGRYDIFWPYWLVRYGIDNIGKNAKM